MTQLALEFQTASPINIDKLSRQNRIVYQHLASGETITLLLADQLYGIRHLHSRISDLHNISKIDIKSRTIMVTDGQGNKVKCKEYSLTEFSH